MGSEGLDNFTKPLCGWLGEGGKTKEGGWESEREKGREGGSEGEGERGDYLGEREGGRE